MYYMVVIECKIRSVCNIPYYYVYFDDDDMFTLIMMMIWWWLLQDGKYVRCSILNRVVENGHPDQCSQCYLKTITVVDIKRTELVLFSTCGWFGRYSATSICNEVYMHYFIRQRINVVSEHAILTNYKWISVFIPSVFRSSTCIYYKRISKLGSSTDWEALLLNYMRIVLNII